MGQRVGVRNLHIPTNLLWPTGFGGKCAWGMHNPAILNALDGFAGICRSRAPRRGRRHYPAAEMMAVPPSMSCASTGSSGAASVTIAVTSLRPSTL